MFRSSTFTQFHEFLADTFIQTGRHRSKKPALDILNVHEFFHAGPHPVSGCEPHDRQERGRAACPTMGEARLPLLVTGHDI
jgi:hypothetical protein